MVLWWSAASWSTIALPLDIYVDPGATGGCDGILEVVVLSACEVDPQWVDAEFRQSSFLFVLQRRLEVFDSLIMSLVRDLSFVSLPFLQKHCFPLHPCTMRGKITTPPRLWEYVSPKTFSEKIAV